MTSTKALARYAKYVLGLSPSDSHRLPVQPTTAVLAPSPVVVNGIKFCGECRRHPLSKGEGVTATRCPVCQDELERKQSEGEACGSA